MAKIILKVDEYDHIAGTNYSWGLSVHSRIELELEEYDRLRKQHKPRQAWRPSGDGDTYNARGKRTDGECYDPDLGWVHKWELPDGGDG